MEYETKQRISAYSPKTNFRVELIFNSVEEAKLHNPHLEDFRVIELIKVKKSHY